MRNSSAERVRFSRRWIAALAYVGYAKCEGSFIPARSCSDWISRSRSTDIRWKSAIMPSIWATLRRFSSTWNFFRRMSVSRDFIDSYSPEVPICTRDGTGMPQGLRRQCCFCAADDGLTKLAFRFQTPEDLLQLAIAVGKARDLVL